VTEQTTIAFVLDFPNEAAEELARLRSLKAWLINTLTSARSHLLAPMPENLEPYQQHGEYAERCGYARGTIEAALEQLQK
jgi:hypothetical protein